MSFSPSFGRDSTTRWCDEREEGGRHAPCAVNHVDDLGLAIARHLQPSDSRIHARVKDCDADISAIPRGCEMRRRHARQLAQYRTSGPPLKGMNLLSKNPSGPLPQRAPSQNSVNIFHPRTARFHRQRARCHLTVQLPARTRSSTPRSARLLRGGARISAELGIKQGARCEKVPTVLRNELGRPSLLLGQHPLRRERSLLRLHLLSVRKSLSLLQSKTKFL